MDDDPQRLNRLLDDLAAERDPRDRAELSATEVELAQTAALLKAAHGERSTPSEEFVERLGRQLVAASSTEPQAPRAGPTPAPGLSRRGARGEPWRVPRSDVLEHLPVLIRGNTATQVPGPAALHLC